MCNICQRKIEKDNISFLHCSECRYNLCHECEIKIYGVMVQHVD